MKLTKNEKGFSIVIVIVIIFFLLFMGFSLVSLVVVDSHSSVNQMQSGRAHFISESGLELGLVHIIRKNCALPPCRCVDISGLAQFTNQNLGMGIFTVEGTFYHSRTLNPALMPGVAELSGNLNGNPLTSSVTVNDSSGYAPYGRLWIGSEAIDYTQVSGDIFQNVYRGADNTQVAARSNGFSVLQNQCVLTSGAQTGSSSVFTSVTIAMQDGWIVGGKQKNGPNNKRPLLLRFQDNEWIDYSSMGPKDVDLKGGVSAISTADVWAAGKDKNGGIIMHFDGKIWSVQAAGFAEDFKGLHMVDTNGDGVADSGWAVGKNGFITEYDGVAWNDLGCSPTNEDLAQVLMTSATDGWIVIKNKNNHFLRYSLAGCNWQPFAGNVPVNEEIKRIFFTSENDGWAVGKKGIILHWSGGPDWVEHASSTVVTNEDLNTVFMLDTNNDGVADIGWGAGKGKDLIKYDVATDIWSTFNVPGLGKDKEKFIFMSSPIEGWLTVKKGQIYYWNGIDWTGSSPFPIVVDDKDKDKGKGGEIKNMKPAGIVVLTPDNPVVDWREVF